jgi:Arylsulfotransferase (ASST)
MLSDSIKSLLQRLILALLIFPLLFSCDNNGKIALLDGSHDVEESEPGVVDSDPSDRMPSIDYQRIFLNPFNFLAGQLVLENNATAKVYAEYGTTPTPTKSTPVRNAIEATRITIDILGLKPDTLYYVRPVAVFNDSDILYGETTTFTTRPWTETVCLPEPVTLRTDIRQSEDEVFCYTCSANNAYLCIDKTATPVWIYENPESPPDSEVQALTDGNFAYVAQRTDEIVVFAPGGNTLKTISIEDLADQSRFEHTGLHHELIEITSGEWTGALAVLTDTLDTVTHYPLDEPIDPHDTQYLNYPYAEITEPLDETIKSEGIVVLNYQTGTVLWDWSFHGETGDNQTIDPSMISYTRRGLAGNRSHILAPLDWTHANALVHGIDPNGEFFWLSSRHQDWIIKIETASDSILWRLGYQGDFDLVDDIDALSPLAVTDADWFFHQHAPEWSGHGNGRYEFTIFDNGNVRPVDYQYFGNEYSRVAVFEIDEQSMLAQVSFEFGSSNRESEDFFYGWAYGDADLMPSGDSILFTTGHKITGLPNPYVGEVSLTDGELMRQFLFQISIYRIDYYPDIYQTTWWHETER